MRSTRTRVAAAGAAATVALGTGCAPSAPDDPATTVQGTSPNGSPWATREPMASPSVPFTTRNGTTTFTLPAGWTVRDASGPALDDGEAIWRSSLVLVDEAGVDRIAYDDPLADRVIAAAWWTSVAGGDGTTSLSVRTALVDDPGDPAAVIAMSGGFATALGILDRLPGCDAVLATYDGHDVPEGTMP